MKLQRSNVYGIRNGLGEASVHKRTKRAVPHLGVSPDGGRLCLAWGATIASDSYTLDEISGRLSASPHNLRE
ncbi:hypothetical protein [Porphyromonas sp.]|uniref:hypothetical protein n=1 Tax=Porphyromonas sp. TaxID=1924944 RepID=UPI003A94343E